MSIFLFPSLKAGYYINANLAKLSLFCQPRRHFHCLYVCLYFTLFVGLFVFSCIKHLRHDSFAYFLKGFNMCKLCWNLPTQVFYYIRISSSTLTCPFIAVLQRILYILIVHMICRTSKRRRKQLKKQYTKNGSLMQQQTSLSELLRTLKREKNTFVFIFICSIANVLYVSERFLYAFEVNL